MIILLNKFRNSIILKNCKMELLLSICVLVLTLVMIWWNPPLNQEALKIIDNVKNSIIDIEAIVIGIYIAIVSILATSETPISFELAANGLDSQLRGVVSAGLGENLFVIAIAVFLDFSSSSYFVVLMGFILITFVSLIKFLRIVLLVFKNNMRQIVKQETERKEHENQLMSTLENILSNLEKYKE